MTVSNPQPKMGDSPNLVRARVEVIAAAWEDLKREKLATEQALAHAKLVYSRAKGHEERRVARRAKESVVATLLDVTRRMGDMKQIRNAVNAERNDAVSRMFVNVANERLPVHLRAEFWSEAERRVDEARARSAALNSTRAGAALPTLGAVGTPKERRA